MTEKEQKTIIRTIRFSPSEKKQLDDHASTMGMNNSTYIKYALERSYKTNACCPLSETESKNMYNVLQCMLKIQGMLQNKKGVNKEDVQIIERRLENIWQSLNK